MRKEFHITHFFRKQILKIIELLDYDTPSLIYHKMYIICIQFIIRTNSKYINLKNSGNKKLKLKQNVILKGMTEINLPGISQSADKELKK